MEAQKFYLLSGIAAFLLFLIGFFLVFPLMYPNYHLPTDSISKLGALDSPIKTIVNVFGFSLWGVLVMIGGYGIFKSTVLSKFGNFAGLLIIIGGFFIYLVGIFPGNFPSALPTLRTTFHNVEHLAFIPITLAFFIFLIDFFKTEKLRWLILPIIVLGPLSLILKVYRFSSNLESIQIAFSGLIQRTALGLPFLVIALISYGIYRLEFPSNKKEKTL
jgi:hypothetical membrane protein